MTTMLSVEGMAKEWGCHPRTVRRLLAENKVPVHIFKGGKRGRGGGKIFVKREDAEKLILKKDEDKDK